MSRKPRYGRAFAWLFALVAEGKLSPLDALVWLRLDFLFDPRFGIAWPGVEDLAAEFGVTPRTIMRSTRKLANLGLLEVLPRTGPDLAAESGTIPARGASYVPLTPDVTPVSPQTPTGTPPRGDPDVTSNAQMSPQTGIAPSSVATSSVNAASLAPGETTTLRDPSDLIQAAPDVRLAQALAKYTHPPISGDPLTFSKTIRRALADERVRPQLAAIVDRFISRGRTAAYLTKLIGEASAGRFWTDSRKAHTPAAACDSREDFAAAQAAEEAAYGR